MRGTEEQEACMMSLTKEQRRIIAQIIESECEAGDYYIGDDGGSEWRGDTDATLSGLANYFRNFDAASIHN